MRLLCGTSARSPGNEHEATAIMSFRRNGKPEREHQAWVRAHRDVLLRTGVPLVAWESWGNWESFLYCDLPHVADPSGFDIDQLSDAQAEELCLFLEAEQREGRDGATVLRRLQHRLARGPVAGESLEPGKKRIHFYGVRDAYGELSNFAPYPVLLERKRWPTSEHYFQAQKFLDPRARDEIRSASTPLLAARLGRDRRRRLRDDWESVKVPTMRRVVEAKFRQHRSLAELLMSTAGATLVEHTETDSFWGDGGDGSGRNMLGRILMEVRAVLQQERSS